MKEKSLAAGAASPGLRLDHDGDHIVLPAPEAVRERAYVPARRGDPTPEHVLSQAEKELEEASGEFQEWMLAEIDKLADARARYRASGPTPEAMYALFQAAHTIRGDAGVFGYPLAGRIADSLSKLLDGAHRDQLPTSLIDQHVDAIRAIVREEARGGDHPGARALALALIDAASKYAQKAPGADRGRSAA